MAIVALSSASGRGGMPSPRYAGGGCRGPPPGGVRRVVAMPKSVHSPRMRRAGGRGGPRGASSATNPVAVAERTYSDVAEDAVKSGRRAPPGGPRRARRATRSSRARDLRAALDENTGGASATGSPTRAPRTTRARPRRVPRRRRGLTPQLVAAGRASWLPRRRHRARRLAALASRPRTGPNAPISKPAQAPSSAPRAARRGGAPPRRPARGRAVLSAETAIQTATNRGRVGAPDGPQRRIAAFMSASADRSRSGTSRTRA